MQIEIDFDVFKALTALRRTEADTYNAVIRRLLQLPDPMQQIAKALLEGQSNGLPKRGLSGLAELLVEGVWFNGTYFPNGTKLRATYKGSTYTAKIEGGKWIDQAGVTRNSPSDAAGAVCEGTNVNGWRFWHALRPGDVEWHRLDELR
ncbi:hypothetical protein [Rhizorhapis sp.]|uniref:hypothetical protein n=1 Tax=Rhizorhapis sp. TaxID=1968842 RepID=UPI002B47FD95|nr:hypothetical protein [Rhizorhapis sp.]HKR16575.1 hypothetical protein [Rhizorhapis sp.]